MIFLYSVYRVLHAFNAMTGHRCTSKNLKNIKARMPTSSISVFFSGNIRNLLYQFRCHLSCRQIAHEKTRAGQINNTKNQQFLNNCNMTTKRPFAVISTAILFPILCKRQWCKQLGTTVFRSCKRKFLVQGYVPAGAFHLSTICRLARSLIFNILILYTIQ